MKFSATFAVLAVFVAKACVTAVPLYGYDSDLAVRSEFVVSLLAIPVIFLLC
jgi:hypothetical protein